MAAKPHIPSEELGEKLWKLEETRKMVVSDLDTLKWRRTRVEELERDKAVFLKEYAGIMPGALE
jgi:hypothetical protein